MCIRDSILTDPLSDQLLGEMLQARNPHAQFPHRGAWLSALEYAAPKPDFFDASTSLEEGLYVSWQWCGARKNTVIRRRFRVYRHNGATVFRGYAPREFYAPGTSPRKREYRGICLNLKTQGFVLLSFFATPSAMIGMIYVSPTHLSAASTDLMVGYSAITRDELPDMPRLSRILIERIDTSPAALVKESRASSFYTLDKIPREYADLLGASVG